MKNEIKVADQITDDIINSYLDAQGITSKLTKPEKEMFKNIAKSFGLNPFKREIYCNVYGEGQYRQLSIITGYEVYLKRAERTGLLDGWKAETTGSVQNGDLKATVTIYRKDRTHPFVWEVLYSECVQRTKTGAVTKFWEKASHMTKKVAISQGFRLFFPDELGGMPYTADEMPDHTEDISHVEVVEPQPTETKSKLLSEKQFEKVLNSDAATIERCLLAIENGTLDASSQHTLLLSEKLKELNQ